MSGITQNTDYKVQWTPELREAVDNRIIEYLLQGYSQQEAEEKALLELLDHTTFNYPEVTVTAQAPVLKQVAAESDWDPGYTKFMSGKRYYADQDHKNYLDWLRNDYTRGIREATDKWGNAIGAGVEIASGFTPLWWVAPAVRTGLDLSEGNYKGAALNAGLAFAAPYAVGKVFQYGDDLYRGYKTMTNPKEIYASMSEAMTPVKTHSTGIWTNRGTRSAKISEAERLGIPKGERNLWLRGTTADASWNSGLGLGNKKYMLDLTDYHFLQKAPDSQLSYSFSGKPEPMYNGNSGFNGKSSSNTFTVFNRQYIKASEFDPNTGQMTVRYNPSDRGFFFSPESRRGTAYTDYGLRKYYLNLKNPRTDSHAFTLDDFLHVPAQNDGVITTINKESLINMADDGFPFKLPEKGSIWEVLAMDPKAIKLAQWNTYDDAGNLIPLSQRHNFNNPDVRYKSGGNLNYLTYSK